MATSSKTKFRICGGRRLVLVTLGFAILGLCGCPHNEIHPNTEFNEGKKAEAINDYDSALAHYNRALKAEPENVEFQLRVDRMRFEAGQAHVTQGRKLADKGDLQMALSE